MTGFPSKCPSCGEVNPTGLSYCAVCGMRFKRGQAVRQVQGLSRRKLSREAKLRLKREKKRAELTELFKNKKINLDQYRKGLSKLGYTTDIDKAEEFKKFIRSQINDLQKMKVAPPGGQTERYDPYASRAELVRDDSGNVITDFMVKPEPANRNEMGAIVDAPSGPASHQGPLFADSLFAREPEARGSTDGFRYRPVADKPSLGNIVRVPGSEGGTPKKQQSEPEISGRLKMVWDEDLDEDDFEIDLDEDDFEDEGSNRAERKKDRVWWDDEDDDWWDEEGEGETGWWDDEEWELDWEEEDEEDLESWGIDTDDLDEDDFEDEEDLETEGDEKPGDIEWEDDDDDFVMEA